MAASTPDATCGERESPVNSMLNLDGVSPAVGLPDRLYAAGPVHGSPSSRGDRGADQRGQARVADPVLGQF